MKAKPGIIGAVVLFLGFGGTVDRPQASPPDLNAAVPTLRETVRPEDTTSILLALSKDWLKGEWRSYREHFVSPDGRVIDNANGGISHSEGQGYGLNLALAADDASGFDTIWRWTDDHLHKRPDALFAWRWDPKKSRVTDLNNASDGDLLIAWALVRAAKRFGRDDYAAEARRITQTWAKQVVISHAGDVLILPGAAGFRASDQPAGPVVNPSYWIFAAFKDLAPLAPTLDWGALRRSGLRLLEESQFGPARLPADWVAVGGSRPVPAPSFPSQFGYNAIRIPLYLAQDGSAPPMLLARYAGADFLDAAQPGPAVVDLPTGRPQQPMRGAGYRMVLALARCAVTGEPIPPDLIATRDDLYFSETLRLLSAIVVQERLPRCL